MQWSLPLTIQQAIAMKSARQRLWLPDQLLCMCALGVNIAQWHKS